MINIVSFNFIIFDAIFFGRNWFDKLTELTIDKLTSYFLAVAEKALTSLGKQEPPNPGLGCKNFELILPSNPKALEIQT